MSQATLTAVATYGSLSNEELNNIVMKHAQQPADKRGIDCRGLAATIVLEERIKRSTPSKQPFNINKAV